MTKTFRMLIGAAALVAAVVPRASAQTAEAGEVMFHWGAVHTAPGQALVLNLALTDHIGDPLTLPLELHVEDREGKEIVSRSATIFDGHVISFAIAPEIRTARATISADVYSAVGPEIRLLQPCIRVAWPPGPGSPVDRMTATLEVIDVVTGRIVSVMNNPHVITVLAP